MSRCGGGLAVCGPRRDQAADARCSGSVRSLPPNAVWQRSRTHASAIASCANVHNFTGATQFEAFSHCVSERLIPLQVSWADIAAFQARVRSASLGLVRVNEVWAGNAFLVRRTPKLIARADADYLKVAVQLSGVSAVLQGGCSITLRPGDFILSDTARPYQVSGGASFRMQTLMFSRDSLQLSSSQLDRLTTRPISGRAGLGRFVAKYLAGLPRQLHTVGPESFHLADATLDLLMAAFLEQLGQTGDLGNGDPGLLLRVRTYIERRLADPELDVASIAAAHHVSVRWLQKLFAKQDQTVTGWIRSRRLEHCRKDLSNPALAETPVTSIAADWGLLDAAYFSRLFKSTWGLSPSEYRAKALAQLAESQCKD
ncbi:helix-turn-helix domain-containing protein [Mycobacterium sp. HNNTM2301]|uniref:AraC-like ligand-binding domain-containing protein n=1 Tax=Mycobacterium hainanense TaxID=3289775 RepID=UPI0035A5EA69